MILGIDLDPTPIFQVKKLPKTDSHVVQMLY